MHKKVQVVVFNSVNSQLFVLLLQTNKKRGSYFQNVTGSVDKGESFIDAAKRELLEETGIDSEVKATNLEFKFHDRWKRDVVEKVFFTTTSTTPESIQIDQSEHQDFKWINARDITENDYKFIGNYQAFKLCLENLS